MRSLATKKNDDEVRRTLITSLIYYYSTISFLALAMLTLRFATRHSIIISRNTNNAGVAFDLRSYRSETLRAFLNILFRYELSYLFFCSFKFASARGYLLSIYQNEVRVCFIFRATSIIFAAIHQLACLPDRHPRELFRGG